MDEELKLFVASNIIKLRTGVGMTQSELGEKLNYSDKTISKWERGEALPGVLPLKQMADIFGVSVDFLLSPNDQWVSADEQARAEEEKAAAEHSVNAIILVSVAGIFTLAVLMFAIFWMLGRIAWSIFVYSIPVMLVTVLVLNSLLRRGRGNYYVVSLLLLGILASIYVALDKYRPWQIFLIAIPAEVLVYGSFHIRIRRKKPVSTDSRAERE